MAITPTNSNTTSITTLPQAQLAVGTDLLLLQTTNGTQTISFNNFNVVKTDVAGNATVVGTITGNSASFNNIAVKSLTASAIATPAGPAVTLPTGFYNQFTIQNGLILSAVSNVFSDPVYTQLYNNDIPNFVHGLLKTNGASTVIEKFGTVLIPAGTVSYTVFVDSFFAAAPNNLIGPGNITPAHFNLASDFIPTAVSVLSANNTTISVPYAVTPIIQPGTITTGSSSDGSTSALLFTITLGTSQSVDVNVYWKLTYTIPA